LRAFIAVDLEPGIRKSLQALLLDLKATRAEVRWVEPGGFHLTLKFLGDIDEARVLRVKAVLEDVAGRHRAFPLRAEGTGVFPGERNPRVLWVGFAAEPGLMAFQAELERALEAEGFAREERAFKPHLTLGRVKGPRLVGDAVAELKRRDGEEFGDMTAGKVALFESRLRPEGAEYRVVFEAKLL
jgi:2'-5' RNA ligase